MFNIEAQRPIYGGDGLPLNHGVRNWNFEQGPQQQVVTPGQVANAMKFIFTPEVKARREMLAENPVRLMNIGTAEDMRRYHCFRPGTVREKIESVPIKERGRIVGHKDVRTLDGEPMFCFRHKGRLYGFPPAPDHDHPATMYVPAGTAWHAVGDPMQRCDHTHWAREIARLMAMNGAPAVAYEGNKPDNYRDWVDQTWKTPFDYLMDGFFFCFEFSFLTRDPRTGRPLGTGTDYYGGMKQIEEAIQVAQVLQDDAFSHLLKKAESTQTNLGMTQADICESLSAIAEKSRGQAHTDPFGNKVAVDEDNHVAGIGEPNKFRVEVGQDEYAQQ